MNILITLCARAGSKGLKDKNIKLLFNHPLIAYSIRQAQAWIRSKQAEEGTMNFKLVLSSESSNYANLVKSYGVEVPFLRPSELATDTSGKVAVLTHALRESEKIYGMVFDVLLDLDVSAPLRTLDDLNNGFKAFAASGSDVCFSVTQARRSPYFNMVERNKLGRVELCKPTSSPVLSRQITPETWDLNASIYFYKREYLLKNPDNLWNGTVEIFEMPEESYLDINSELDFFLVETIIRNDAKYHI